MHIGVCLRKTYFVIQISGPSGLIINKDYEISWDMRYFKSMWLCSDSMVHSCSTWDNIQDNLIHYCYLEWSRCCSHWAARWFCWISISIFASSCLDFTLGTIACIRLIWNQVKRSYLFGCLWDSKYLIQYRTLVMWRPHCGHLKAGQKVSTIARCSH